MPKPGYYNIGGQTSLVDNARVRGVYAQHPAASPKYHTGGTFESTKTMARLYIMSPNKAVHDLFIKDKGLSSRAQQIASVLSIYPNKQGRWRGSGAGYIDFLLTAFSLQQSEQMQITEVLADASVVYYFGQNTLRGQLSGTVFNTRQDDWYDAWMVLYEELCRGTKLAQRGQQVIMRVDTRFYYGSFSNTSSQLSGAMETAANFSAGFVIKKIVMRKPAYINRTPTFAPAPLPPTLLELEQAYNRELALNQAIKFYEESGLNLAATAYHKSEKAAVRGRALAAISSKGLSVPSGDRPLEESPETGSAGAQARSGNTGIPDKDLPAVNASQPDVGERERPGPKLGPPKLNTEL